MSAHEFTIRVDVDVQKLMAFDPPVNNRHGLPDDVDLWTVEELLVAWNAGYFRSVEIADYRAVGE